MKALKAKFMTRFLLPGMFAGLLCVQPVTANESMYYSMGTGSSSNIAAVLAIAVGVVAITSSVDCMSEYPSFPMCQAGGSSYRGPGPVDHVGSMASMIVLHDRVVRGSSAR